MDIRNYTRFLPFVFSGVDPEGRSFGVLVLQGSFEIVAGGMLKLEKTQPEIMLADVYHESVNTSSLRFENALAPYKHRADIHINAVAHAPGGWPSPSWTVGARIGKLERRLRVTGPRQWIGNGNEYRMTDPEPCVSVPIRYEHAFGGVYQDAWGNQTTCDENPLGKGFVPEGQTPTALTIDAPQIEDLDAPIVALKHDYQPMGLGPIPGAWMPRRKYAGTYDEPWRRERWPNLPLDFDYKFYNSAHPKLIYPGFLNGTEQVVLENLSATGHLDFRLPGYEIGLVAVLENGSRAIAPMLLDTLMIDVPEKRVLLTWRGVFSKRRPIRALEIGMAVPGGKTRG